MTTGELGQRVLAGAFIIAGELRGCELDEAGYVDRKTGIAEKTLMLTYFVECSGTSGFEFTKITRRFRSGDGDPEKLKASVRVGQRYAFNIEAFKKERGFRLAYMSGVDPIILTEDSAPDAAPSGAAPGANP